MKMEGLNKGEQVPLKEEAKMDFDNSNPEVAGGVSKDYGNAEAVKAADQVRAEALKQAAEADIAKQKDDIKIRSLADKIKGYFGQSPEKLRVKNMEKGEDRMRLNPNLRSAYEKFLSEEGAQVADAYKEAIGKWKYIIRDKEGNFVDKTIYSVAAGETNKLES